MLKYDNKKKAHSLLMSPDFCVLAHRSVHVNPHKQEDIQLQSPDDSTKVNQPAKNNPLIQR